MVAAIVSETLPEKVACSKLQNGSKIYYQEGHPNELWSERTRMKLHELPVWYAGEIGNALYFYTVNQKDVKTRTYNFFELITDNAVVSTAIDFREIGTLTTEKYIKFALQQPYFLDFGDYNAVIIKFNNLRAIYLNSTNTTMLGAIVSHAFNFFVWREPLVVVVRRTCEANHTSITREIFYDMEMCVITSVFAQEDAILYMLCGATLFAFKDDFAYAMHKIDPPGYRIGGAENRRLFLNATMRFFSHDLPDDNDNSKERERTKRKGKFHLKQTLQKLSDKQFRDMANVQYKSRFATDYDVKGILGIGGGGCVFAAANKHDEVKYAVKRITVDPRNMNEALKEVRALAKLDHLSIVRYHSTWVEEPPEDWQYDEDVETLMTIHSEKLQLLNYKSNSFFIYIQMQLGNGDMAGWLRKHQTAESRPLSEMKAFFKQIVRGVKYLHDKNFIHRDLKPANILFFEENRLKICDMGIVIERRMENGQEQTITHIGSGTTEYMSPEQRLFIPQLNSKSDVFTLGLIFAELCVPMDYDEKVKIFESYREGKEQTIFGEDLKTESFVRLLTNTEKTERPTCREILDHDYVA